MTLTKRERTIALVTGILVGVFGYYELFLSPLLDRLSTANRLIADDTAQLKNADNLLDNRKRAEARMSELAKNSIQFEAPAAESKLLNRVLGAAQSTGMLVASIKPERSEQEKGFDRIILRASATGNMSQLSRFIYALDTADMPVRIGDLQIGSRKDGLDDLSVQMSISTIFDSRKNKDADKGITTSGVTK